LDRARTDGAELAYEVSGTGEPVVFIHGAFIADTFRRLLAEPRLAGRYRLILYHRRGYAGSSRVSGPVGIAQQDADCQALLRHLGVERAHVVGHSCCVASPSTIPARTANPTPGITPLLGRVYDSMQGSITGGGHPWCGALAGTDGAGADGGGECSRLSEVAGGGRRALPGCLSGNGRGGTAAGAVARVPRRARPCAAGRLRPRGGRRGGLLRARNALAFGGRFGEAEAHCITQPDLSALGSASDALSFRFGVMHRLLAHQGTAGQYDGALRARQLPARQLPSLRRGGG
jgi:hypothetical protein